MRKMDLVFIATFICNWCFSCAVFSREERSFPARQLGQSLAKCLAKSDSINCFKNKVTDILDQAIANNETWQLGDFLVIEKNTNIANNNNNHTDNKNTFENVQIQNYSSDKLAWRVLQLAQSRSLKLQLPSISANLLSSLKAFNTNASDVQHGVIAKTKRKPEEGTFRDLNGLVDGKFALNPPSNPYTSLTKHAIEQNTNKRKRKRINKVKKSSKKNYKINKNNKYYSLFNIKISKGRRKKHKDKTMAMMGGMAMLAMIAQLFLGKVILVAGAAFVMAKVALLISTLGSFKKGTIGNGNDHVIVAANGRKSGLGESTYEFHTDWHRRIPPYEYNKYSKATRPKHKFLKPSNYYESGENNKFPRQSQ